MRLRSLSSGVQAYKHRARCYTSPPEKPVSIQIMQRLLEFTRHHYLLSGGALLAAVAVILYELRARAQSFAALSAMQAVRLMNQGAILLDVRGKEAFEAGHIGDAQNIPAADLEGRADS